MPWLTGVLGSPSSTVRIELSLAVSNERKVVSENWAVLTITGGHLKPLVKEYIDLSTGEVIDAHTAKSLGVRSIRPDAMIRRSRKLDRLRKEPRQFASFMLSLRDDRCKFLVPIKTIITWYGLATGKETHHVKRYLRSLVSAEIVDEDGVLNEDFMIHNPEADKRRAKGDLCRAYNVLDRLMMKSAF